MIMLFFQIYHIEMSIQQYPPAFFLAAVKTRRECIAYRSQLSKSQFRIFQDLTPDTLPSVTSLLNNSSRYVTK